MGAGGGGHPLRAAAELPGPFQGSVSRDGPAVDSRQSQPGRASPEPGREHQPLPWALPRGHGGVGGLGAAQAKRGAAEAAPQSLMCPPRRSPCWCRWDGAWAPDREGATGARGSCAAGPWAGGGTGRPGQPAGGCGHRDPRGLRPSCACGVLPRPFLSPQTCLPLAAETLASRPRTVFLPLRAVCGRNPWDSPARAADSSCHWRCRFFLQGLCLQSQCPPLSPQSVTTVQGACSLVTDLERRPGRKCRQGFPAPQRQQGGATTSRGPGRPPAQGLRVRSSHGVGVKAGAGSGPRVA